MKSSFTIFSISTAAFLMLSGCSTSYKALGFNGGYSEIKTTLSSFIVTFKGNEFTSQEKVMQYALRRASELTIQNGYKYFSVISSTENYSETEPKLVLEIKCFKEETRSNLIDAEYFFKNN